MTTTPTPEPDWLDRLGAWCLEKLTEFGLWCLAKLMALAETILAFLAYHWLFFAILVLAAALSRRVLELQVLTAQTVKTLFDAAIEQRKKKAAEGAERRQAARFQIMTDEEFNDLRTSLRTRIKWHGECAKALEEAAYKSNWQWREASLRASALDHSEKARLLSEELARLEGLWRATQKSRIEQRERDRKTRVQDHILDLIEALASGGEAEARAALAKLNALRTSFDWRSLVPAGIPAEDQRRVLRLIEVMVGTSQLGEARNAFAFVQRVFADHNFAWWTKMAV
jgi:hypothetical protein